MANEVFKNDRSIVLDWESVFGANLYHVQVALDPDFATMVEDDDAVASSTHSFTDNETDDKKRWYRWRSSADAGATWGSWSDVGSYWLKTGGTGDIDLTVGKWAMFGETDQSDFYQLETFPMHKVVPVNLERDRVRNRRGEMINDYLTTKDVIELTFKEMQVIGRKMFREFKRFHIEHKTFFLAGVIDNGEDEVANVWKVQFAEDPEFEQAAASRNDYHEGTLRFEEV